MSLLKRIIKKKCLNCKKEIIIEYLAHGSGSANPTNKKYCSLRCKREFLKNRYLKNRIKKTCIICGMVFYTPISVSKRCCSNECRHELNSKTRTLKRKKFLCLFCKKQFLSIDERKYCSLKCFYNNSRKEIPNCKLCCRKVNKYSHTYCSKACASKALSLGRINSFISGRRGYRKDIQFKYNFKSRLEADYARFLIFKNIDFEYENKVFTVIIDNKEKYYTPDFFIKKENKYIDLKCGKGKKFNFLYTNLDKIRKIKNPKIEIVYGDKFYKMLKKENLEIENIEGFNNKLSDILICSESEWEKCHM
jgi:hypothetical protein